MATRGITLLSLNSNSYGKFALGMLASIKQHTKLPVQLIHDGISTKHIEDFGYLDKFDVITEINEIDYSTEYQFDPARAKVNLYKYLTFDETIYLDVDGIMLDDITPYFDILKDEKIHIQGMANIRPSMWAKKEKVNKYIKLNGDLRDINSSFIYVQKSKEAEDYFNLVSSYYSLGEIPADELDSTWGGLKYPDELFFSIGMAQYKMASKNDIAPIYFNNGSFDVITEMAKNNCVVMSLYGNTRLNNTNILYLYDVYAKKYLNNMGIEYIWNIKKLMKNKHVNSKNNPILLRGQKMPSSNGKRR